MKIKDILVEYVDHMGDDDSVVNSARVSFSKVASNYTPEQNTRLIRYLAKHKHFSPFNHTFISVKVNAPLVVARQLVKHEYMPINEVSRRYVDDEPTFFLPHEWRKRSDNKKQGSSEEVFEGALGKSIMLTVGQHTESSLDVYSQLLALGVCPEQARMVLPQNMNTEWYWSGTLKAFAKMLVLRLDPHTQKESTEVARQVRNIIQPLFPVSVEALLELK